MQVMMLDITVIVAKQSAVNPSNPTTLATQYIDY
jgi:hypothetical protein